ncbi:MAG: DUF2344 domain-containing protein [Oscillospiraceae bacterium]|nr:DUF2344 domain-containing protein [Oscillospiraceae bacterium]
MDKLRLVYEQTGRARWISHLDAMRTLQRGLNRADVPIKYSEGFNPHALISILMPLSVGTESLYQMADIRVREEVDLAGLPERLTLAMPEGFRFRDVYENGAKPTEMKWLRVRGVWEYDERNPEEMTELCRELFSRPVQVMRKTKRGEGLFTVTEHIRDLRFVPGEKAVTVEALLSCNEPMVNPDLLTAAVAQNAPEASPDGGHFCRLATFKADDTAFR